MFFRLQSTPTIKLAILDDQYQSSYADYVMFRFCVARHVHKQHEHFAMLYDRFLGGKLDQFIHDGMYILQPEVDDFLPPSFMKNAHSRTRIQAYIARQHKEENASIIKKYQNDMTSIERGIGKLITKATTP